MGSETQKNVPIIDLSKCSSEEMKRGSKEWNDLCKRVTKACEEYGCFEVIYDKISAELREEVFKNTKELFELPLERKKKNTNPKPFAAYSGYSPAWPLLESFGIEDASNCDSLKAFFELLLDDPVAQNRFCQSFSNMVKNQNELHNLIWTLILDSFGIQTTPESTISSKTLFRMLKYIPPPPGADNLGAFAHTDKPLCTILCEDQCSGLEVHVKETDQWIQWNPTPNSYIFIVGDPLVAWTNGRLHAVKHRVIMRENKERYTLGNFVIPDDGTIIEPRKELINEDHPQKFKEFEYSAFMSFCYPSELNLTIESDQQLYVFAGI